ncbi:AbiU2 domain-containing protein [Brumimicrobium mesophilum]|uniref:AbiU2 domain-containing protein n=1 Tax=Brumimicrobium mesophilum TaxID=392717 RepID=UPI00131A6B1D|nr:hypothetical protein [Brumimicrobium mesophilum]
MKAVWPNLKNVDKSEQELLFYLKNSSRDYMVLYLAKLFDNRSNRHPTRCIDELLYQLEKSEIDYKNSSYTIRSWVKFQVKYKDLMEVIFISEEPKIHLFLNKISEYIQTQKKAEGNPLNTLKIWRDKFLAHNESFNDNVVLDETEVEFILMIPESILKFLDEFTLNQIRYIERPVQTTFITNLIQRTKGLQGD